MTKAEFGCKTPEQAQYARQRVLDHFLLPPAKRDQKKFRDPGLGAARPAKPNPNSDEVIVVGGYDS